VILSEDENFFLYQHSIKKEKKEVWLERSILKISKSQS
jgi:hypothetical protein